MSASANRSGPPVAATTTTAGVPGTSAQVRTFAHPARPVYVTNCDTTDDLYIKVNKDDASSTDFLVKLTPGQAVELSTCGIVNVKTVSLYFASSAYSGAKVVGWYTGI